MSRDEGTKVNLTLAGRRLAKTPFVSSVAILLLVLGIGANAAIFSLFDQTLLRSLPVQRPAELAISPRPVPRRASNTRLDPTMRISRPRSLYVGRVEYAPPCAAVTNVTTSS